MAKAKKLTTFQQEALDHARAAGGLEYVRGGYWVEAGTDHEGFLEKARRFEHAWHTQTATVQALTRRGLLTCTQHSRHGYPLRYEAAPQA